MFKLLYQFFLNQERGSIVQIMNYNYAIKHAFIYGATMLKSIVCLLSCFVAVTSTNSCDFNVKITQTLRNEGFHRNITYEIVFNDDEDVKPKELEGCIVGLDQTLPAGVYANADELGDLKRMRKLYVVPKNAVNIELPAEQSSPSSLHVMGTVKNDRASLWLPVHARYHKARSEGGMARNEISPPRVFLRCPAAQACFGATVAMPYFCDGGKECWKTYKEITFTMLTDTLIWEVPVGNTNHYYAVAGGTALVVAAGSLYLLKTVHQFKLAKRQ